jgi:hypothetical protein
VAGDIKDAPIPASALTGTVHVVGRYQTFDVDPETLSVHHYTFTGAANPLSLTGGRNIEAFASKVADLRGRVLTGPLMVTLDKETILALARRGRRVDELGKASTSVRCSTGPRRPPGSTSPTPPPRSSGATAPSWPPA